MKVKIISFALMMLMLLSIMPFTILAAEHTHEEEINTSTSLYYSIVCLKPDLHVNNTSYTFTLCNSPSCSLYGSYICDTCYPDHFKNHYNWHWDNISYCGKHHTNTYVYCPTCRYYYCPTCEGSYHTKHDVIIDQGYCYLHKEYYTYCNVCKYYYCYSCYGGYHQHGGISHVNPTAVAPNASLTNNSVVEYGATVTLSSDTKDATIFYTLDGSNPTIYSTRYTGAITLTQSVTLKAIAVRIGMVNSSTSTYKFTVRPKVGFTDINDYPGLSNSLSLLVDKGVVVNGTVFNPSKGFTLDELSDWLYAIGINLNDVKGIDHIDDDENLTYNDFIYVLYKALRSVDYIKSPKGEGYKILKKFPYEKNIVNASFYKAGFVSFYENNLLYDINFNPENEATRTYLATAIAAVINNNNL